MTHHKNLESLRFPIENIFDIYKIEYVTKQLGEIGFRTVDYERIDREYHVSCMK